MNCKMIIMDMDGTLLNSDGKISERTKKALMRAQEKGAHLVLASGRSWKTLKAFGEELNMPKYDGWFIGVNGAALTETKTMEHQVISQLQLDEIYEIFEVAKPFETEIMGVLDATIYDYIPASLRELKKQYRIENKIADDVPWTGGVFALVADQRKGYSEIYDIASYEEIPCPVNKMTFCHTEEKLSALYAAFLNQLSEKYNFVRTSLQWIECTPKSVSKGNAIRMLQEKLHISKEETIIFGDGENDLSMFSCGYAVAMGNAMDTVKKQADEVTLDNNHDGIGEVLEKLF